MYNVLGMREKIKSFTDLNAWREAHKLVLLVYKVSRKFPKEEIYGLTVQIRWSVVSVTSNIAEGFSRRTVKEKIQFYFQALGSLTEVQNQIIVARDLRYLFEKDFLKIASQTVVAQKLINGMIKRIR